VFDCTCNTQNCLFKLSYFLIFFFIILSRDFKETNMLTLERSESGCCAVCRNFTATATGHCPFISKSEMRFLSLCSYHVILTHSLTPRSRVLLEMLIGFQPVKKFPAFYGAQSFITPFTSAHQLSLSSASPIQSIPPHPTS